MSIYIDIISNKNVFMEYKYVTSNESIFTVSLMFIVKNQKQFLLLLVGMRCLWEISFQRMTFQRPLRNHLKNNEIFVTSLRCLKHIFKITSITWCLWNISTIYEGHVAGKFLKLFRNTPWSVFSCYIPRVIE